MGAPPIAEEPPATAHECKDKDHLKGGKGKDLLDGFFGADTLKGDRGGDTFSIDAEEFASGRDRVLDFDVGRNKLQLANVFDWLGESLGKSEFLLGKVAKDKNDHVLYDAATGIVRFDHDGKGGEAAVAFVEVRKGLALSHSDFELLQNWLRSPRLARNQATPMRLSLAPRRCRSRSPRRDARPRPPSRPACRTG
jgi:hypothetical protein